MSQPRKKPRQQRAAATWDAILEAAAQLFQRSGYAATTTNKVAERAGVSIGSLYQYFPNKDALLVALAERHLAEASQQLAAVFDRLERERPGLPTTLALLIDAAVALHRHNPAMHRLLFDLAPRTEETAARLRALEKGLALAVALQLRRLGVGGEQPQARALLLVQGLEAQVHGAVLEATDEAARERLIGEMHGLWLAALEG